MEPATLPLAGDRWTPFVHEIEYQGLNLVGPTFGLQVRLNYDAPGAPLIDLGTVVTAAEQGVRVVYNGEETIASHIAAGRMSEVPPGALSTDLLPLTIFGIRINETTMEGLPFPAERGDDAVFVYDLHVTPTGQLKQNWFRGTFTVRGGATQ